MMRAPKMTLFLERLKAGTPKPNFTGIQTDRLGPPFKSQEAAKEWQERKLSPRIITRNRFNRSSRWLKRLEAAQERSKRS